MCIKLHFKNNFLRFFLSPPTPPTTGAAPDSCFLNVRNFLLISSLNLVMASLYVFILNLFFWYLSIPVYTYTASLLSERSSFGGRYLPSIPASTPPALVLNNPAKCCQFPMLVFWFHFGNKTYPFYISSLLSFSIYLVSNDLRPFFSPHAF